MGSTNPYPSAGGGGSPGLTEAGVPESKRFRTPTYVTPGGEVVLYTVPAGKYICLTGSGQYIYNTGADSATGVLVRRISGPTDIQLDSKVVAAGTDSQVSGPAWLGPGDQLVLKETTSNANAELRIAGGFVQFTPEAGAGLWVDQVLVNGNNEVISGQAQAVILSGYNAIGRFLSLTSLVTWVNPNGSSANATAHITEAAGTPSDANRVWDQGLSVTTEVQTVLPHFGTLDAGEEFHIVFASDPNSTRVTFWAPFAD